MYRAKPKELQMEFWADFSDKADLRFLCSPQGENHLGKPQSLPVTVTESEYGEELQHIGLGGDCSNGHGVRTKRRHISLKACVRDSSCAKCILYCTAWISGQLCFAPCTPSNGHQQACRTRPSTACHCICGKASPSEEVGDIGAPHSS